MAILALAAVVAGAQVTAPERRQLQTTILQTLINDPELGQYPLAASVSVDSKVTLNGVVPNKPDRDEAEKLVKSIPGVKGVNNEITVNASVTPLTQTAAATPAAAAATAATPNGEPSTNDVQTAVSNALASDPALRAIHVAVNAEAVTLTGSVATKAECKRAQQIAARNAPKRKILNQIEVKQPPR